MDNYTTNSWMDISKFKNIGKKIHFICDDINAPLKDGGLNIYISIEPDCIYNDKDYLLSNWKKYDFVFTYDPQLLRECKNSRMYYFGSSWINQNEYNNINVLMKKFKMSTLIGQKNFAPGHSFRQKILHTQKEIPFLCCYRSGNEGGINQYHNEVLFGSKVKLFSEYQYSLVIENNRCDNWFTEKIIDCLICRTIPVYYGDPSISNVFNTTGWIILDDDNIDILKEKLNTLTNESYAAYKDIIEYNFNKALYYSDFYQNISRILMDL
jgi:hypothetical protein